MANDQCFLCEQQEDKDQQLNLINSLRVPASQKPVSKVLQHLANGIRTKLVFHCNASICAVCLTELTEYDSLMINLLRFQQKLMRQLQCAVNKELRRNESDFEDLLDKTVIVGQEERTKSPSDVKHDFIDEIDDFEMSADDGLQDEDKDTDTEMDNETTDSTRGRPMHECLTCCMQFSTGALWKAHMQTIHTKIYKCNMCTAERRDEEYLELHKNIHYGKTEKECRYCPKKFTRPVNALRHMRKHWDKKKYQCEKCGERFSQDNVLYNHKLLHEAEENPVICSICNQSFKTRKTFSHHVRIHQADRPRHQCSLCIKSFTERYTLKMHMKTHYAILDPTPTPIQEEIVYREHSDDDEITETTIAQDKSTSENTCLICSTVVDSPKELEFHMKNNHNIV